MPGPKTNAEKFTSFIQGALGMGHFNVGKLGIDVASENNP
jgi:hypothetical protein